MERWDDVRLCLIVAREGSFTRAAAALGVNQSTVSRRVEQLEQYLGATLFVRGPRGLSPTDAGDAVLQRAERMEAEAHGLSRDLLGQQATLEGSIRLATADVLAERIADLLSSFLSAHPGVSVELTTSNHVTSLARREADLSLRGSTGPPEHTLGRRICNMGTATYVRRGCDPTGWVAWDHSMGAFDLTPIDAPIRMRADSAALQRRAIREGVGRGVLACFVGDLDPELERVEGTFTPDVLGLWILTHVDLRSTARVRALMRHLADGLTARRHLFEGDASP